MIFYDFLMFLGNFDESKEIPRKIMKSDETPLNFRKNNKSQKKNEKS